MKDWLQSSFYHVCANSRRGRKTGDDPEDDGYRALDVRYSGYHKTGYSKPTITNPEWHKNGLIRYRHLVRRMHDTSAANHALSISETPVTLFVRTRKIAPWLITFAMLTWRFFCWGSETDQYFVIGPEIHILLPQSTRCQLRSRSLRKFHHLRLVIASWARVISYVFIHCKNEKFSWLQILEAKRGRFHAVVQVHIIIVKQKTSILSFSSTSGALELSRFASQLLTSSQAVLSWEPSLFFS